MKTITKLFAIIVVLGLVFGFMPATGVRAGTSVNVVTPASPDWNIVNDNGVGTWSAGFEVGPGVTPPFGIGSAFIELNTADAGILIGTQKYQGVRLADITALRYSTYTNLSPAAMVFQINYDPDVTTVEASTWYGRLNYEPYMSGTVTNGTWQTWDMLTTGAKWWASPNANSTVDDTCPQGAPCTLAALLSAYPNIGIRNDAMSLIQFKAGSNWSGFAGNVDGFVITTASNTDIYDFEPLATAYVDDDWSAVALGADPDGAGPAQKFGFDSFAVIQDGIDAVIPGGTVYVAAGTYPEVNITINKSLTLIGDPGDTVAGPGANAPLIDGGGAYGDAFKLANGVANVTIKGFEIANFASNDTGIGNGVSAWVGSTTYVTIQDNYFHSLGWNGILVGNDYSSDPAKWGDHTNWLVKANVIEDFGYIGVELTNTSTSVVEDNVIHMSTPDIGAFFSSARRSESGLTVRNNYIDGTPSTAYPIIYVYAYDLDMPNPNLNNVVIEGNTIAAAAATPFQVYIRNIGTGTITNVLIEENALLSLKNLTSQTIDAAPNWWGQATGPTPAQMSGTLTYIPWCTDAACSAVAGPVHNVTQDTWFAAIQPAIDAANSDDVIQVSAGTYVEYITINKDLSLIGAAGAIIQKPAGDIYYKLPVESSRSFRPIVLAYGGSITGGDGLTAATPYTIQGVGTVDVIISGFTIDGGDAWTNTTSLNFADGILLRNVVGEVSSNTIDGLVSTVAAQQYSIGIEMRGDNSDIDVIDNNVTGFGRTGIYMSGNTGAPKVTIKGNTVTSPYYGPYLTNGIEIAYGATGTIEDNDVTGATGAGTIWTGTCVMLYGANNSTVTNNRVSTCDVGISVGSRITASLTAQNNTVIGNTVQNCTYSAIEVNGNATNTKIQNNIVSGVAARTETEVAGILILQYSNPAYGYPNGVLIEGNTISGNPGFWGIDIYRNVDNITIQGNTVTGGAVGVALELMNDNSIGKTAIIGGAADKFNKFLGQTEYAIATGPYLYESVPYQWLGGFDATYNWFGAATGPDTAKITTLADYIPWCANDTCTAFGAPVVNITQSTYFGAIQEAIDDPLTTTGDIIVVAAGTYPEQVNITKAVTLRGPNTGIDPNTGTRVAEAIIAPVGSGTVGITVQPGIGPVTVDGFTVQGYTDWGFHQIYTTGTETPVHVLNNIFDPLANPYWYAVEVNSDGSTVLNNLIKAGTALDASNSIGIVTYDSSNLRIEDNIIGGSTLISSGIVVSDYKLAGVTGVTISGNTVTNTEEAIMLYGNEWEEPVGSGNWLHDGNISNVTIDHNIITVANEAIQAFSLDSLTNLVVEYNQFNDVHTTWGTVVDINTTDLVTGLDLSPNWWDKVSGPVPGTTWTDHFDIYVNAGPVASTLYARWCGDPGCTTLINPPVHNITQDRLYLTIQAAVDDADPGDVIEAAPGLYDERVNITKPLTLYGATHGVSKKGYTPPAGYAYNPAIESIIMPTADLDVSVLRISSDGVVVDGFVIANTSILTAGNMKNLVEFTHAIAFPTGSSLVNSVIGPLTGPSQNGNLGRFGVVAPGPSTTGATATRVMTIADNYIYDCLGNGGGVAIIGAMDTGIEINTGTQIINNTITGHHRSGIEIAGMISGTAANPVLIANNNITNNGGQLPTDASQLKYGNGIAFIRIGSDRTNGLPYGIPQYVKIFENVITGNEKNGIYLGPIVKDLTIEGNTIQDNGEKVGFGTWDGIHIDLNELYYAAPNPLITDVLDNVVINSNNLTGNGAHEVNLLGGTPDSGSVDASENWWGAATGPTAGQVAGDFVTCGWLDGSYPTGTPTAKPVTNANSGLGYCTIQAAIDDATAGDVISVAAGTYVENVVVNKSVELAGAGAGSTIVVPAVSNPNPCTGSSMCGGLASNVILVEASDVKIHDLTVDGDNPALTSGIVRGGADLDARNGIIKNTVATYNNLEVYNTTVKNIYLRGVYSTGGSFNFHDNTVTNVQGDYYSIAMFAWYGPGIFQNNVVSYANDGISANHSNGIQFLNNTISFSGSGIHTDNMGDGGGVPDLISGNTVSDCLGNNYGIWTFVNYLPVTVQNNTVTGCALPYSVWGSGNTTTVQFTNNTATAPVPNADSVGIYVTTSGAGWGYFNTNANFTGNTLTGFYYGIYLGAEETSWDPAPYVEKTITSTISRNNITGSTSMAVYQGPTGIYNALLEENWWGSVLGPQAPITEGLDVMQWCGTANPVCLDLMPQSGTTLTLDGTEELGEAKIFVPGLTVVLADSANIANAGGPCFSVNADHTTIMAATKLGAACTPAAGFNGIDVAGGLTDINIANLEFTGAGTDGIHFNGVVDYLAIFDNWFHGLAGDAIDFGAHKPTGDVFIQGNLFEENTGLGIRATVAIPAEFNSWGHIDGAALGDGASSSVDWTPWTHVDLYLGSTTAPVVGQPITFTVYGNLKNTMGAAFTLKFPADKLTYLGATNLSGFIAAGPSLFTTAAGEVRFNGIAPTSTPISGVNAPIFSVTFLVVGDPALLDLDETTDLFAMVPTLAGPSTNIYALKLVDAVVTTTTYKVRGTFYMQGHSGDFKSGIPGTLTGMTNGIYQTTSISTVPNNMVFNFVPAQSYIFTTLQPRYLNITPDLAKEVTVTNADVTFASSLVLLGGNAIWTDNIIDVNDASAVGSLYGIGTIADNADVTFDGLVNILDLSLVGGNMDKTSSSAYASWDPQP